MKLFYTNSIEIGESEPIPSMPRRKSHPPYISPALYTTPEATPLPDSPRSFPPSPYLINHKRRGPRLLKRFFNNDVFAESQERKEQEKMVDDENDRKVENSIEEVSRVNGSHDRRIEDGGLGDAVVGTENLTVSVGLDLERDCEGEDFFDPQDSMSVASNTEVEENNGVENSWKPNTPTGEYFDACEDLSIEGASQSSHCNIEAELREIRLNLLMEIERRKQTEEALDNMQNQWQRIRQKLSLVGFTVPANLTISLENGEQPDVDPAEELCQHIELARVVSTSVGRGSARAEVELEMEAQIEAKNFEITRLSDRLQYYETVNREMSQRNQEAIELARRHRQRRKRRQKWVWSSTGLAITLGSAALAWLYLQNVQGSSNVTCTSHSPEGDDAAGF